MARFIDTLVKILEMILVILLVAMCCIIFVSTGSRFTGLFMIPWAEEFARYCMIGVVFMGIPVAAIRGEHFCVEALKMVLPSKVIQGISILNSFLIAGFSLFVSYYALFIIRNQITGGQLTPSLQIPIWMMYAVIPLGLILLSLMYVWHTFTQGEKK